MFKVLILTILVASAICQAPVDNACETDGFALGMAAMSIVQNSMASHIVSAADMSMLYAALRKFMTECVHKDAPDFSDDCFKAIEGSEDDMKKVYADVMAGETSNIMMDVMKLAGDLMSNVSKCMPSVKGRHFSCDTLYPIAVKEMNNMKEAKSKFDGVRIVQLVAALKEACL